MKWIFGYGSRVLFYISSVHPLVLDTSVGVKPIASIHDWAEVYPMLAGTKRPMSKPWECSGYFLLKTCFL